MGEDKKSACRIFSVLGGLRYLEVFSVYLVPFGSFKVAPFRLLSILFWGDLICRTVKNAKGELVALQLLYLRPVVAWPHLSEQPVATGG